VSRRIGTVPHFRSEISLGQGQHPRNSAFRWLIAPLCDKTRAFSTPYLCLRPFFCHVRVHVITEDLAGAASAYCSFSSSACSTQKNVPHGITRGLTARLEWIHLRTTSPVESLFASGKASKKKTKGAGSRNPGLAMALKLSVSAEKRWRWLTTSHLVALVRADVRFLHMRAHMLQTDDPSYNHLLAQTLSIRADIET